MLTPFSALIASFVAGALNGAPSPPVVSAAPHVVEITGRDYSFAVPREIAAGAVTFRFSNKGSVIHEMAVALLVKGVTPEAVIAAVNNSRSLKPMTDRSLGILIARPHERSSAGLTTQLEPGRDYLVICRFQDGASAPLHSRMGMLGVIHVPRTPSARSASQAAPMPLATNTIVGTNYAFDMRGAMAAGLHRFRFVNAGSVKHEMNVALLARGTTPEQIYAAARAGVDVNRFVDEWLGLLIEPRGRSSASTLDVPLLAGRTYVLMCELSDDERSPKHLVLGMFGVIEPSAGS